MDIDSLTLIVKSTKMPQADWCVVCQLAYLWCWFSSWILIIRLLLMQPGSCFFGICSKFNSKFHAFAKRNGEEKPIICFTVCVWCSITSCPTGISAEVCMYVCMYVDVNERVVFSALLCVRVDCSSERKDCNITAPLLWHEPVRA